MKTNNLTHLSIETAEGIKCIGRRQLTEEYKLSPSKTHRLLQGSGIDPIDFNNKHWYPENEVREYFQRMIGEVAVR